MVKKSIWRGKWYKRVGKGTVKRITWRDKVSGKVVDNSGGRPGTKTLGYEYPKATAYGARPFTRKKAEQERRLYTVKRKRR